MPAAPATLVKNAMAERLFGDPDLTRVLATYGGVPAIFTGRFVPGDATMPYAHLRPLELEPFDALVERGWTMRTSVAAFVRDTGSDDAVEALAERIRELFHQRPLELPTASRIFGVQCSGVEPEDEEPEGTTGRRVPITVTLRE